jgi:hypothetical protein
MNLHNPKSCIWKISPKPYAKVLVFAVLFTVSFAVSAHDPVAELSTRLEAAELELADVSALKGEVAALAVQISEITLPDLAPLQAQITALQTQVSEISTPDLSALTAQITALEARVSEISTGVSGGDTSALQTRLSELTDSLTALEAQTLASDTAIHALQATCLSCSSLIGQTAVAPKRLHGLSAGTLIPSDGHMKQTNYLDVLFTIETFTRKSESPPTWQTMVLLSRDESGQAAPGHFTLYIGEDRRLRLRSQGAADEPQVKLQSQQQLEAGERHRAQVIIGPRRTHLFLDGVEVGISEHVNLLAGNDLPMVVGATCWGVTQAICEAEPAKRKFPFAGTISADLYANPVDITIRGMALN